VSAVTTVNFHHNQNLKSSVIAPSSTAISPFKDLRHHATSSPRATWHTQRSADVTISLDLSSIEHV